MNGAPDMAYSKLGPNMNYDELNMFTGSLIYSIPRFIFSTMAQCPPKYATAHALTCCATERNTLKFSNTLQRMRDVGSSVTRRAS